MFRKAIRKIVQQKLLANKITPMLPRAINAKFLFSFAISFFIETFLLTFFLKLFTTCCLSVQHTVHNLNFRMSVFRFSQTNENQIG